MQTSFQKYLFSCTLVIWGRKGKSDGENKQHTSDCPDEPILYKYYISHFRALCFHTFPKLINITVWKFKTGKMCVSAGFHVTSLMIQHFHVILIQVFICNPSAYMKHLQHHSVNSWLLFTHVFISSEAHCSSLCINSFPMLFHWCCLPHFPNPKFSVRCMYSINWWPSVLLFKLNLSYCRKLWIKHRYEWLAYRKELAELKQKQHCALKVESCALTKSNHVNFALGLHCRAAPCFNTQDGAHCVF